VHGTNTIKIQKELVELKRIDPVPVTEGDGRSSYTQFKSTPLYNHPPCRWCPVLTLPSHIHITTPYALHCDSNNWNCCVFKLQKAAIRCCM